MGKLLGRGAFGSVYEVTYIGRSSTDHGTGTSGKYAIKIVRLLHYLILSYTQFI